METKVCSEPATFCGGSSPQSSSARRSTGTRWPRAASRISSTCFGLRPAEVSGPEAARRRPRSRAARTAGSPASRVARPRLSASYPGECADRAESEHALYVGRAQHSLRTTCAVDQAESHLERVRRWTGRGRRLALGRDRARGRRRCSSKPTPCSWRACATETSARSRRLSPVSTRRCWPSRAATSARAASPKRSCRKPGSACSRGSMRFEGRSTLRTWVLADRRQHRARSRSPRGSLAAVRLARTGRTQSPRSSRSGSAEPTSRIQAAGGRSRPTGARCRSRGCSHARRSSSSSGRSTSSPTRSGIVITLRDVIGCSAEEVCETLGISQGNQRVLLHRARARVRTQLERHLDG